MPKPRRASSAPKLSNHPVRPRLAYAAAVVLLIVIGAALTRGATLSLRTQFEQLPINAALNIDTDAVTAAFERRGATYTPVQRLPFQLNFVALVYDRVAHDPEHSLTFEERNVLNDLQRNRRTAGLGLLYGASIEALRLKHRGRTDAQLAGGFARLTDDLRTLPLKTLERDVVELEFHVYRAAGVDDVTAAQVRLESLNAYHAAALTHLLNWLSDLATAADNSGATDDAVKLRGFREFLVCGLLSDDSTLPETKLRLAAMTPEHPEVAAARALLASDPDCPIAIGRTDPTPDQASLARQTRLIASTILWIAGLTTAWLALAFAWLNIYAPLPDRFLPRFASIFILLIPLLTALVRLTSDSFLTAFGPSITAPNSSPSSDPVTLAGLLRTAPALNVALIALITPLLLAAAAFPTRNLRTVAATTGTFALISWPIVMTISLAASNAIPLEVERDAYRQLIEQPQVRLADVDLQVSCE